MDISQKDLQTAQQRLQENKTFKPEGSPCHFVGGDGLKLPFGDASFDRIICSEVLEHIPHYHGMLQEINRVLKPGGQLAISVPRAWPERICWRLSKAYHSVEGGHIRIFSAKKLQYEIRQQHFNSLQKYYAHALHVPYWWLRCLFWEKGDQFFITKAYHRILVWDLMQKPWLTQTIERLLNPILGKSVVMHFKKQ